MQPYSPSDHLLNCRLVEVTCETPVFIVKGPGFSLLCHQPGLKNNTRYISGAPPGALMKARGLSTHPLPECGSGGGDFLNALVWKIFATLMEQNLNVLATVYFKPVVIARHFALAIIPPLLLLGNVPESCIVFSFGDFERLIKWLVLASKTWGMVQKDHLILNKGCILSPKCHIVYVIDCFCLWQG